MDGVGAVMDRIQDIQSRIAAVNSGSVSVVGGTGGTASTASSGGAGSVDGGDTTFASELSTALGETSATGAGAATGANDTGGTSGTGSAAAGGSGGAGARVVADAKRYLGVPYVWGGTDPATGLDCSGLVQRVFADLGVHLPRVSRDQARAGTPVASVADARPGDLVAFGSPVDHIGIYVGDGKMIAAPYPGKNVRIEPLPSTPTHIRRIVGGGQSWSGEVAAAARTGPSGAGTPYARLFDAATARYGLPDGLLEAVAKAESSFRAGAVSSAGAQGLMQLMPATAQGLHVNPFDPAQAIDGAARLLHSHLKDFGSVGLALAAYNAGPGAVRKYGGVPPYAETQAYVVRVQGYQKEYAR